LVWSSLDAPANLWSDTPPFHGPARRHNPMPLVVLHEVPDPAATQVEEYRHCNLPSQTLPEANHCAAGAPTGYPNTLAKNMLIANNKDNCDIGKMCSARCRENGAQKE
jgi:hypothetical protein